ncbi:MAG: hypothetical protein C6I00_03855 [Nitratiruptor sp.]|nr:hypothetical protein [Nitratiruptor sp.]NPA83917.1 hypothetical protein [Campylobacterota bacterium]
MFQELLTSIALLLSALSQDQPVQGSQQPQQVTQSQQIQESRSTYRYITPTTVAGRVFVGSYRSIDTDTVKRIYRVRSLHFDTGHCIIASQTPEKETTLDPEGYFSFRLNFTDPCPTDVIYVSGELVMENKVVANGQTFVTQSVSKFGPKPVVNQEPIHFGNVDFIVEAPRQLYTNTRGELRFLLMDQTSKVQVDPQNVEELVIKSSNALLLKIVDGEQLVSKKRLSNVSDGRVTIQALGKDGQAAILLLAKIKNEEGFVQKVSKSIPLTILYKPQEYMIEVENEDQAIILGQTNHITVKVLGSEDLHPLSSEKIVRITIRSLNDRAKLVDLHGNVYDEMSVEEVENGSVDFLVRGEELGTAEFEVEVLLQGLPNQDRLVKRITYPVTRRLNNTITLEYVGTDYNKTSGFFIDTYTIKLRSSRFDGSTMKLTILNPKVDTDWYYQEGNFFTFESLRENPFVYFDGFRDGSFSGSLEQVGEDLLKFSTSKFDLEWLETYRDKLIIIPNGASQDPNYLGGWTITSILNNHEILLQGSIEADRVEQLTFVIGNESRWDPKEETISNIVLDHPNGLYTIRNRQVRFQIIYPKFFGGKDIFINASIGNGRVRVGNSFKRTLTGTKLDMPGSITCKKAPVCAYDLKIVYTDANYGLSYSNFGVTCDGDQVSYFYFTPTNTRCRTRRELEYGGSINLQKTNGWGFVRLCIYPAPVYEEKTDPDTNQTYQVFKEYGTGRVSCKNPAVAVEFPY